MKILIINCGSSSLKYELYDMPERISCGKGQIERIGQKMGKIAQEHDEKNLELCLCIPDHKAAFGLMMTADAFFPLDFGSPSRARAYLNHNGNCFCMAISSLLESMARLNPCSFVIFLPFGSSVWISGINFATLSRRSYGILSR